MLNKSLISMVRSLFTVQLKKPEVYQARLNTKPKVYLDKFLRVESPPAKRPGLFTKKRLNKQTLPLEPLKYKLQEIPPNHNMLFPLGNIGELPFFVERTSSHNLPVYTEYKQQRMLKYTIIRRISGNAEELVKELEKVTNRAEIHLKVGSIVIHGLHSEVVTDYLCRLGF